MTRGVSDRSQAEVCGSYRAGPKGGAGYCVFSDIGVLGRAMIDAGDTQRALVVDLDVHQGDGTAFIFEQEPRVFTSSIYGKKNYPVRRGPSDLDIDLPDGTGDEGLFARDSYVLETCLPVVPVVGVIGGGYDNDFDRLARRHATLHRATA